MSTFSGEDHYLTINHLYGGRDLNINLPARFIPGDPQTIPDFRKARAGSITITSINGVSMFDNVEEYYSLAFEDEIWGTDTKNIQSEPNIILPEIKALLIADINSRTNNMEPEMTKKSSFCGTGGCWTPSDEMIAKNNKMREDAINACQAVVDKYHLELFPPKNLQDTSGTSTGKVKLTMNTDPPGAWCRCTATKFWGVETRKSYLENVFLVEKTPGTLELPKGEYKSVLCRCVLQDQNNFCRNTAFQFSGDFGGKIDRDIVQHNDFADTDRGLLGSGDCRSVDSQRCNIDSDCFNNGFIGCYRKDMVWMRSGRSGDYTPAQRANSKGCECVKGECELRSDVDQSIMQYARSLRNQTK